MQVDGPDLAKYGGLVPNGSGAGIAGLIEKPHANKAPSNLFSTERYVLTPHIFHTLRGLSPGSGGEVKVADSTSIHAQQRKVGNICLNGWRFD